MILPETVLSAIATLRCLYKKAVVQPGFSRGWGGAEIFSYRIRTSRLRKINLTLVTHNHAAGLLGPHTYIAKILRTHAAKDANDVI